MVICFQVGGGDAQNRDLDGIQTVVSPQSIHTEPVEGLHGCGAMLRQTQTERVA